MMDMEIISYIGEYGSLAAFTLFLVWHSKEQAKKIDTLTKDFRTSLEGIQQEHKTDEETLRARYDAVIGDQRTELERVRAESRHREKNSVAVLQIKLEDIANKQTELGTKQAEIHRTVFANMKQIKNSVNVLTFLESQEKEKQLLKKATELAKQTEKNEQ